MYTIKFCIIFILILVQLFKKYNLSIDKKTNQIEFACIRYKKNIQKNEYLSNKISLYFEIQVINLSLNSINYSWWE